MSAPDAESLLKDARATSPTSTDVEGGWDGHLISLKTPDSSLLNQVSPVLFHAKFQGGQAQYTAAGLQFARAFNAGEFRKLGPKTLLGKWTALDPSLAKALGDPIYFVLKRP